jgi:hypothetical protein
LSADQDQKAITKVEQMMFGEFAKYLFKEQMMFREFA